VGFGAAAHGDAGGGGDDDGRRGGRHVGERPERDVERVKELQTVGRIMQSVSPNRFDAPRSMTVILKRRNEDLHVAKGMHSHVHTTLPGSPQRWPCPRSPRCSGPSRI